MSEPTLQDTLSFRAPQPKKIAPPRKRFQSINNHHPVLVLDEEGTIRFTTTAARRLLEYRNDQSIDPCFFTHVHGRNLYQVMRDVADIVCYGKHQATWLLRLRTGQGRWHWYKASVVNELGGPDEAIVITLQDLHDL